MPLANILYNTAFNGLLNNIPPCGFFPHKCITLWPFYDEVVSEVTHTQAGDAGGQSFHLDPYNIFYF